MKGQAAFLTCLVCISLLTSSTRLAGSVQLRSDLDDSGTVDFPDFLIFVNTYNQSSASMTYNRRADFNDNGSIDFDDFLLFLDDYGDAAPDVGNDIGNGLEIVHGPDGPSGGDRDNAFRSLTVHPQSADTLLLGTERNGFVKSADGGETWTRHRLGLRHLPNGYPEIWDIAYDPRDPRIVYAATLDSPGPVTGDYPSSIAGVYKSEDGGETWARKNCGLTSSRITSVAVPEGDRSVVVIGVEGGAVSFTELQGEYFAGGLYRSEDAGESWNRAVTVVDDSTSGYWHMVSREGALITFGSNLDSLDLSAGFLRSEDEGATWEPFGSTLRSQRILEFSVSSDSRTIVGNARDSHFLHISEDGGQTWRASDINQANGPVSISPADSKRILFVATQRKINLSLDGLATFVEVIEAEGTVTEIVFAPSDPAVVYAVTEGSILYRSVDSGASFVRIVDIRNDVLNP